MSLDQKKRASCETGTEPLKPHEAARLAEQVPGWTLGEKKIERTFKFKNFVEAMEFANKITQIAESENHHPNLHISWGRVTVELSTHSVGGLSINDFIVASKIDKLV